jgi:hypothetical protein
MESHQSTQNSFNISSIINEAKQYLSLMSKPFSQLEFKEMVVKCFSFIQITVKKRYSTDNPNSLRHTIQRVQVGILEYLFFVAKALFDKAQPQFSKENCVQILIDVFTTEGQRSHGGIYIDFLVTILNFLTNSKKCSLTTVSRMNVDHKINIASRLLMNDFVSPIQFEFFVLPLIYANMKIHLESSQRKHSTQFAKLTTIFSSLPSSHEIDSKTQNDDDNQNFLNNLIKMSPPERNFVLPPLQPLQQLPSFNSLFESNFLNLIFSNTLN